jgi:hypothetical protein
MTEREWKRALLEERIRDLSDAKLKAFMRGNIYQGAPDAVLRSIGLAIRAFEDDELDLADTLCQRAEIKIMEARVDGPRNL